jgi:hypothetical protein
MAQLLIQIVPASNRQAHHWGTVYVDGPGPVQHPGHRTLGGATGELTAALQYWVQSFHVENAAIRDMLQDIAIEEFSHLVICDPT